MGSRIHIKQIIEKEMLRSMPTKDPEVLIKIGENQARFRSGVSLHDLVLVETNVGFVLYKITEKSNTDGMVRMTLTLKKTIYKDELRL